MPKVAPKPVLRTERLELWRPVAEDLGELFALTFDEETRRFLGSFVPTEMDAFNRLLRNAGSWALYGYGVFMVRLRGQNQIIGTCGVFRSHRGFGTDQQMDNVAEAGWIVHRDHWGQGIAREAMTSALNWFADTHGPQRITCMIEEGHSASERIAAALGFVPFGRQQEQGHPALILYQRL